MEQYETLLAEYVTALIQAEGAAIEEACERAIATEPWRGVLVVRDHEGMLMGAEPDASVPVGHIYEVTVPRP